MDNYPALAENLKRYGQEHLLKHLDELEDAEKARLARELAAIDLATLREAFARATAPTAEGGEKIEPVPSQYLVSSQEVAAHDEQWRFTALREVAQGRVAAVVLAGGQGSRLGFEGPKGCYDAKFPSRKSLFQLQAEHLVRVCALASPSPRTASSVPLYVMTSPLNRDATMEHFESHAYFGLDPDDVVFFSQGTLPCLTEKEGKLMLETRSSLCTAPDGNGGLFTALSSSGALADMERRGIRHVHVYAVDNPLACPADPGFLGCCIEKRVQTANCCVVKERWDERVGVAAMRNGRFSVVEYSEISEEMAKSRRRDRGDLTFGAANICNHYFALDFIRDVVIPGMRLSHHVARKKIPCLEEPDPLKNNGIKLELFVFDAFSLASRFCAVEMQREACFAPIKNADGVDSPASARALVSALHERMLRRAGAAFASRASAGGDDEARGEQTTDLVEISPLVTLTGEGLSCVSNLRGFLFARPCTLELARASDAVRFARSATMNEEAIALTAATTTTRRTTEKAEEEEDAGTEDEWEVRLSTATAAAPRKSEDTFRYEIVRVGRTDARRALNEMDGDEARALVARIHALDVGNTTPMQALELLSELRAKQ